MTRIHLVRSAIRRPWDGHAATPLSEGVRAPDEILLDPLEKPRLGHGFLVDALFKGHILPSAAAEGLAVAWDAEQPRVEKRDGQARDAYGKQEQDHPNAHIHGELAEDPLPEEALTAGDPFRWVDAVVGANGGQWILHCEQALARPDVDHPLHDLVGALAQSQMLYPPVARRPLRAPPDRHAPGRPPAEGREHLRARAALRA
mmetsp:Transcript_109987/g.350253  ORF Transcript_109987/g.350253 Transcript_109987/m.350253 type:complete len:202 (+) Transcript_109987:1625-2230(+)